MLRSLLFPHSFAALPAVSMKPRGFRPFGSAGEGGNGAYDATIASASHGGRIAICCLKVNCADRSILSHQARPNGCHKCGMVAKARSETVLAGAAAVSWQIRREVKF